MTIRDAVQTIRHSLVDRALTYYAVIASLYAVLTLSLPANKIAMQTYNLTPIEYHVLLFLIALPSLAVWFAAFYGYTRLTRYARSLKKAPEAPHFAELARGCIWLAWSLPATSLSSILLNSIANQVPGFHPTAIIIVNYIALLLPLIGFSVISLGTRGLIKQSKIHFSLSSVRGAGLAFVSLGVLFCYLIFRNFDFVSISSSHNPYFLPGWLLVLTLIIPYLYSWFVGMLAIYELSLYSQQTKGLLYRRPFRLLALGLGAVVAGSIMLQYLYSVTPRVGHLALTSSLLATTIVRIISGVGYIMLAIGARRLQKIEEI